MNNREKLKKLIDMALLDALDHLPGDNDEALRDAQKSERALMTFIAGLNLDPVLETYEQAAKREGWKDGKESWHPKTKEGEEFPGGWESLCRQQDIERQIIDASRDPS